MKFRGLEKPDVFSWLKRVMPGKNLTEVKETIQFKKAIFIASVCTDAYGLNFYKPNYENDKLIEVLFAPGKNDHNVYTYGEFIEHIPTTEFKGWSEDELFGAEELYNKAIDLKRENTKEAQKIITECIELFCKIAQKFEDGIILITGPTYEGGMLLTEDEPDIIGNLALIHNTTEQSNMDSVLSWIPLVSIIDKCQKATQEFNSYKEFIENVIVKIKDLEISYTNTAHTPTVPDNLTVKII